MDAGPAVEEEEDEGVEEEGGDDTEGEVPAVEEGQILGQRHSVHFQTVGSLGAAVVGGGDEGVESGEGEEGSECEDDDFDIGEVEPLGLTGAVDGLAASAGRDGLLLVLSATVAGCL